MPGFGFHYGLGRMVASQMLRQFTLDVEKGIAASDYAQHFVPARCRKFSGGAGCIYPRTSGDLVFPGMWQHWDSQNEKSDIVDPIVDMELFEAASRHIPESDYKMGIRIRLLLERELDKFIRKIIDFSNEWDSAVLIKESGRVMPLYEFNQKLTEFEIWLDRESLKFSGFSEDEIKAIQAKFPMSFSDNYRKLEFLMGKPEENPFSIKVEKFLGDAIFNTAQYLRELSL